MGNTVGFLVESKLIFDQMALSLNVRFWPIVLKKSPCPKRSNTDG